jgi:hypothetical protein
LTTVILKKPDEETQPPGGVYFNDGCVRCADYIYVSAKWKDLDPDEYEFSTAFRHKSGQWACTDFEGWDVVSVCHFSNVPYTEVDGWGGARLVALSTRGDLSFDTKVLPPMREKIADVEELGAASQVRQIGDRLYVCGMQGQVYRRDPQGWVHIDQGIVGPNMPPDAPDLNGIDGTSERDVYVCGFGGRILHFDGQHWDELISPTNVHLERVHCISPSEVYFCGNRGTFFKLSNGLFTDYSIASEDHFWGMTSFQGKIYLANLKGLFVFDGTSVRAVDTKLKPPIGGYRLDACAEQLWSFGVDDIAWFDGKKWTRLEHPENAKP